MSYEFTLSIRLNGENEVHNKTRESSNDEEKEIEKKIKTRIKLDRDKEMIKVILTNDNLEGWEKRENQASSLGDVGDEAGLDESDCVVVL